MMCDHVYMTIGSPICPKCGKETHDIDWKKQEVLKKQWKTDNPNAEYEGWMSI